MCRQFLIVVLIGFCIASTARGTAPPTTTDFSGPDELPAYNSKDRLLSFLPPSFSDGLDFDLWGWLGGTHSNEDEYNNWYDAEVGLAITKSFDQRVAISAQGNFIDANGTARAELEQVYVSAVVNENLNCFITVGKFNSNFGTEARDFWSRSTASTSLLFGAQPEDLVGGMITLPVGTTGCTLRPFLSEDFQGQFYFNQPPSAGMEVEYQPVHGVSVAVTNWVGPGFVLVGGHSIQQPYVQDAYGDDDDDARGLITGNWQGPNLSALRGGTLYFVEAKATWQITPALHAAGEFLQATSGTKLGRWGWFGAMTQVDYDLTDKWRLFGRFSFLDDDNGLVIGQFQRVYEYSLGSAYDIYQGVEVRGEFRHDSSDVNGDVNSVSVHLALTY